MRTKITLNEEYQTKPTRKTIDKIFQGVIDQIRSEMNTMQKYQRDVLEQGGVTKSHIVVREQGHNIHIKLKSSRGKKEIGYLIETEIGCAANNINTNLVKGVCSKIESIIQHETNINS